MCAYAARKTQLESPKTDWFGKSKESYVGISAFVRPGCSVIHLLQYDLAGKSVCFVADGIQEGATYRIEWLMHCDGFLENYGELTGRRLGNAMRATMATHSNNAKRCLPFNRFQHSSLNMRWMKFYQLSNSFPDFFRG